VMCKPVQTLSMCCDKGSVNECSEVQQSECDCCREAGNVETCSDTGEKSI
jgi:hypothetical protein